MAEDELKLRVVLDPNGLQSQLAQLKQEVGLTVQGALSNAAGSVNVMSHAAGMLAGDVQGALGSVLTAPRAPDDVTLLQSATYAAFPGVTAPRSYDVQRWGQMHADRVSNLSGNYAMNLTHGLGKTLADWGAFSVGMDLTMAAMGGAAMTPMGAAAVVGGLGVGMLAGNAGAEFYEKTFQRSIMGVSARGIIGNLGERFGVKPSDDIIRGVQDIQAGGGYSISDASGALSTGLQFGVFGQVRGAEDFKEKFKSLMKGAKEIASTMNTSMDDAVQTIAQMQGAGFGSIENAVHSLRAARITARSTGIPTAEANELMLAGASMSMGTGFSAAFGASSTMANYEAITMGLRAKQGTMGALDMEAVMQLGGRARAAQAMTQSNMAFLEGPLGRATLLASYDPSSGKLDPGRSFGYSPGMAYRQAVDTMRGSDNPMSALLEFAGKRTRLASELAPEEVALSQVQTWTTLARMVNPKGPVTNDMLVGAASLMGVNPEIARTQISQATNLDLYTDRQQRQREELSRAAQQEHAKSSSIFARIGDPIAETGGRAIQAASPYVPEIVKDIAAGGAYGAGEVISGVGEKISDTGSALSAGWSRAKRWLSEGWNQNTRVSGAAFRERQQILDRTTGESLGELLDINRSVLRAEDSEKARVAAVTAVREFVIGGAKSTLGMSNVSDADLQFFEKNMADFETYARLGPGSREGMLARRRLERSSEGYEGGSPQARLGLIKNMSKFRSQFSEQVGAMHRHLNIEAAAVQAREVLEVLGGAEGDTAASKAYRAYEATAERTGISSSIFAGARRALMAAVDDPTAKQGRYGRVLEDVGRLREAISSNGGAISLQDIEKLKLSTLSSKELDVASKRDGDPRLSYAEVISQAMAEIGATAGKTRRGAAMGGATAYTGANRELYTMIEKTGRALDGVTELLESLKGNKALFP